MSEWKDANNEIHKIYQEKGPRALMIHLLEQFPEAYQSDTIDSYRLVCRMHFGSNPGMSAIFGLAALRMNSIEGDKTDRIAEFVIDLQEQLWEQEKRDAELGPADGKPAKR